MKNQPIRDEFLEKRKARQRKARKKRFIASCIFIAIISLITAVILCLTVFFPINKISASGSKVYTNDEIVSNSGIKVGDNIFTFGQKHATERIRNKLPFIEKVEFVRTLPDTLKIKVTDAKPYYCYLQDGVYYNVSKSGWVLEKVKEKQSNVFEIRLSGVKCTIGNEIVFKDEEAKKRLESMVSLLSENKLKIDYVDVTNFITLKVGVEGRFDVDFGTENSLENKIMHLKGMIEEIPENESGSINLSMWNTQKPPQGIFVKNNTN